MSLAGKNIAITGSASGIGQATALECAARGASSVHLCDLDMSGLNTLAQKIQTSFPSVRVTVTQVDVSKSDAVDYWINEVATNNGTTPLHGACNIAGVDTKPGARPWTGIVDMTDDHWNFVHDVNLSGVFFCVRAQMRIMKRGASIVNASSVAGLRGAANAAAYCSSKHGVVGLTKCAAREAGPSGVRVNAICPGPIDTPLLRRMMNDDPAAADKVQKTAVLGPLGSVTDVAKSFCYLLSDDAAWVTGTTMTVDGGAHA